MHGSPSTLSADTLEAPPGDDAVSPRFTQGVALALLLNALLVLPLLGVQPLWQIDEGRIAEVAREMALSGDFVTPRIGELPFACYPPLSYWVMALTGKLLGFNEFAMRLPSALAGIGLIAVLASLSRRLAGEKAALAAAVVLSTLPGFVIQQGFCRSDVLTSFLATLAFDRFVAWAEPPAAGRRIRDLGLMYLFISLGILAKGPIAAVMLGLAGLAWFLIRKRWILLRSMHLEIGIPASLVLILPWYVLVYRANGWNFLHENLILENFRAFTDGYQQRRPPLFYFKVGLPILLPWILVLLLAWPARRGRGLGVALAWFGGVFLFLTLSSAKRLNYITYLCPALAMSAGIILVQISQEDPQLLKNALVGGALAMAGSALAVAYLIPASWWHPRVQTVLGFLPMAAGMATLGAVLITGVTWSRGAWPGTLAAAVVVAVGTGIYGGLVAPKLEPEGREGVAFCRRIAQTVPKGDRIGILGTAPIDGYYHFYVGAPLPSRKGEPGFYLVTPEQRSALLDQGRRIRVLDSARCARQRDMLFIQVIP
jgi:4-amino-4-deoxy-L-arabinose transferase-like glycosyltransferase